NPLVEDVFVQIRPANGFEALCAKVPANRFMRMHGMFKFWDSSHTEASTKGLDDLSVKVRKDGAIRLRTQGRRVQMQTPAAGQVQVTTAFRNAAVGDASTRCAIGLTNFTPRR